MTGGRSRPGFFARHILRKTELVEAPLRPIELPSFLAHIEPFIQAYTAPMRGLPDTIEFTFLDWNNSSYRTFNQRGFDEVVRGWVEQWGFRLVAPLQVSVSTIESELVQLEKIMAKIDEAIERAPEIEKTSLRKIRDDRAKAGGESIGRYIAGVRDSLNCVELTLQGEKNYVAPPVSTNTTLRLSLKEHLEAEIQKAYRNLIYSMKGNGGTEQKIQKALVFKQVFEAIDAPRERLLAALQVALNTTVSSRLDMAAEKLSVLSPEYAKSRAQLVLVREEATPEA